MQLEPLYWRLESLSDYYMAHKLQQCPALRQNPYVLLTR